MTFLSGTFSISFVKNFHFRYLHAQKKYQLFQRPNRIRFLCKRIANNFEAEFLDDYLISSTIQLKY